MNKADFQRSMPTQGLVLSGGGARAAYQVGCLRELSRSLPEYHPQILTGVSAGAINAVHLASHQGSWQDNVESLNNIWRSLSTSEVYETGLGQLLKRSMHWGLRLASGGKLGAKDIRGMVDNRPLQTFLKANLANSDGRVEGISENLHKGALQALAIISTHYADGRSVAWVESNADKINMGSQVSAKPTHISIQHIMASAALPLFFPAVSIDGQWHGDGGVRLAAPLSPAMHLGAKRILAVSPRAQPLQLPQSATNQSYPSPAQVAGVMLNAIFLDLLDYDAIQMERINGLLANLPEAHWGAHSPVDVMVLRPQEDLGHVARDHEVELPKAFRFFKGGFAGKNEPSGDALSMVNFEPEYLGQLIDLGEQDTAERIDEISAFLHGSSEFVSPEGESSLYQPK
ncbi:MAG: NTE family protein [Candidatus Azotimanducaceae bacterium]|jgi:NTE family protein|tara:strand:- start:1689 stop:2891 length:1203 start_codon:yes stop_codon:yes gene_type:complete